MSQSVDKAISILVACAQGPHRLGELAAPLEVHKSTVLRLLQAMERRKFVRRQADGKWTIGPAFTSTALAALENLETRSVAHPKLLQLAEELGHTLHLAELVDHDIIYVDKVDGQGAVRMLSRIGAPVELHTAAVAKVILAFLPPEVSEPLIARRASFRRFTPKTLTSAALLSKELEAVRQRGWAVDDGELEDYISCVAVPIRGADGQVVAGLSLTALKAIEPLEDLKLNLPRLTGVAAEISLELGWDAQQERSVS